MVLYENMVLGSGYQVGRSFKDTKKELKQWPTTENKWRQMQPR